MFVQKQSSTPYSNPTLLQHLTSPQVLSPDASCCSGRVRFATGQMKPKEKISEHEKETSSDESADALAPASMRKWFRGATSVLFYCALFMVIGPALMLVNKHIMQEIGFDYPLTLSVLGLLTSAIYARVLVGVGLASVRPESAAVLAGSKWFKTALPIAICKAITLASGNAVYLHLGLGFIQMLKAFTPCVVLVVMRLAGVCTPSRAAVGFVLIIVTGTLIEVHGELQPTLVGLILMTTSEVAEAFNLVLTQKLLQNSKFTIVEGMYVLAMPGSICLLFAAMVLEWPRLLRSNHQQLVLEHPLWFAGAAFLGLSVNWVGFLVVQATSSLTSKILNTARGVGLVFIGVIFYGEVVSPLEMWGYGLALAGFFGYNFVQMYPDKGQELERTVDRFFGSSVLESDQKIGGSMCV